MAVLIRKKLNSFEGIICHNNHGDLQSLLNEYYTSEEIVEELFQLGEIVYLHSDIGRKHTSKEYQYDLDMIARNNMWSTFKSRDHLKNATIYTSVYLIDVIVQCDQADVFLFENLKWTNLIGI
jgi:hypothetical protein